MANLLKSVINTTTDVVSKVTNATIRRGSNATSETSTNNDNNNNNNNKKSKKNSTQDGILVYVETGNTNSLTIAWAIPGENLHVLPGSTPSLNEYELKYYAKNASAITRARTLLTHSKSIKIDKLTIDTEYVFQLRRRSRSVAISNNSTEEEIKKATEAAAQGWSPFGPKFTFKTNSYIEQEIIKHGKRFNLFFQDKLLPYEEPDWGTDTLTDKGLRVGQGLLNVVHYTGVGGSYMKAVNLVWRLRKIGIGAILFNEQLRDVAETMLSLLTVAGKGLHLSAQDITVGAYYLLWIRRAKRLRNPNMEKDEHNAGQAGVIEEKASDAILDELAFYMPLAWKAYSANPSEIQWFTHQYPGGKGGNYIIIASSPKATRVKRTESGKGTIVKPAYFVAANETTKEVVISIRGSHEIEDLTVDGTANNVEFEIFGNKYSCHNGMLESANWLGYEGKMIQYTKELFNRSYKIVLTGHSLGAGICVLLALILRKEIPDLMPVVYAYAPPPCVSAALAEKCKSELITVKGLINRDDFVCRASAANARALASEIKARRQQWEPFLRRDFSDVYKRTLTLWAPMRRTKQPIEETNNDDNTIDDNNSGNSKNATKSQRTKSRSSSTEILSLANVTVNVNEKDKTKTGDNNTDDDDNNNNNNKKNNNEVHQNTKPVKIGRKTSDLVEEAVTIAKKTSELTPLLVAGNIVHIYQHNGVMQASLVDYNFIGLQRIEVYENAIKDHYRKAITVNFREVKAGRNASQAPPTWEALDFDDKVQTCKVCHYDVNWVNTANTSVHVARATNHCYCCGYIVCEKCCQSETTLPNIGIYRNVKVCDNCWMKLLSKV